MEQLEEYAKMNNVPIIKKDGLLYILNYIKNNNVKSILEIGCAIGYSAINMALVAPDIKITTIERNKEMYDEALKNIDKFNLSDRINVLFVDAMDANISDMYDFIFIDAAKAGYIKFFEKFKHNLNDNGAIIADNLNFHGLTEDIDSIKSKNLKALVRKINNFKLFLKDNKEFKTEFIDVGDGLSVSKKD